MRWIEKSSVCLLDPWRERRWESVMGRHPAAPHFTGVPYEGTRFSKACEGEVRGQAEEVSRKVRADPVLYFAPLRRLPGCPGQLGG